MPWSLSVFLQEVLAASPPCARAGSQGWEGAGLARDGVGRALSPLLEVEVKSAPGTLCSPRSGNRLDLDQGGDPGCS